MNIHWRYSLNSFLILTMIHKVCKDLIDIIYKYRKYSLIPY